MAGTAESIGSTSASPGTSATGGSPVLLAHHGACSECNIIVKEVFEKRKIPFVGRDIYALPLAREEIRLLLEGHDIRPFLNPRSSEYRDRNMKERTPTLDLAVELMFRDPTLLRHPIVIRGDEVFPVVIQTDAETAPPELLKFLGIEEKKELSPVEKRKQAAAAAAAAKAGGGAAPAKPDAAKPDKPAAG